MKNLQENLAHDIKLKKWIQNTKKTKPYVDQAAGKVYWGTDAEEGKKNENGSGNAGAGFTESGGTGNYKKELAGASGRDDGSGDHENAECNMHENGKGKPG